MNEKEFRPKSIQSVPTVEEYKAYKIMLASNLRGLVMMRLAAETGVTRIELAHVRKDNLDAKRSELYLPRSKAVQRKKDGKIVYIERNRWVPINASLLALLIAYIGTHDSPYIFNTKHHFKKVSHLKPESINRLFTEWGIKHSPHKFRHYFKMCMKTSMVNERSIDYEVIREIMGHSLSVSEKYGFNSLEYKLNLVNRAFGD